MTKDFNLAVKFAIETILKWTDEGADMAAQVANELASLNWQQVIIDQHHEEIERQMWAMRDFIHWWEEGGNFCDDCKEDKYVGGYRRGPMYTKTYAWPHSFSPYRPYLSPTNFAGRRYCWKHFQEMQTSVEDALFEEYKQRYPDYVGKTMFVWQKEMRTCDECGRLIPYKSCFHIGELYKVYCLFCVPVAVEKQFGQCTNCNKKTASLKGSLCHDCYDMKSAFKQYVSSQQLSTHLGRARKAEASATLTLKQWANTVSFFGWKCAYCQSRPFEVLEHFLPISLGGGTTVNNCVPACSSCNTRKGNRHPDTLACVFPQYILDHIWDYLQGDKQEMISYTSPCRALIVRTDYNG